MHDRSNIIQLHVSGSGIREIAKDQGISRNAVRRAVAPGARLEYWRPSATEDIEPAVRDVLADYPHMTVKDVAVLVDWRKSRRTLSDLVTALRPEYIERAEAESTGSRDIEARSMNSLQAGTINEAYLRNLGEAATSDLQTKEVDWWTELAHATRV